MAANGIHDGTVPTAQQASFSSIHKFIQSFFFFFFTIVFYWTITIQQINVFNKRIVERHRRKILIQRLKFRLDY